MAHHKRRKPKDRRAGCLWCKPHKSNSVKNSWNSQTFQEQKSRISEREQRSEVRTAV